MYSATWNNNDLQCEHFHGHKLSIFGSDFKANCSRSYIYSDKIHLCTGFYIFKTTMLNYC